jgi:hypothetical protein
MSNNIYPTYYSKPGKLHLSDVQDTITDGLEPMEAYYVATCLKYLYRFKKKAGVEDLRKAGTFIDMTIRYLENGSKIVVPEDDIGKDKEYELKYTERFED